MDAPQQRNTSPQNQRIVKPARWPAAMLLIAAPAIQAQTAAIGCERSGNASTIDEARVACQQDLQEMFAGAQKDDPDGAYIYRPCTITGSAKQGYFAGNVFAHWFTTATTFRSFECKSLYDIILADGIQPTPEVPHPTGVVSPTKSLGQPACDACVGDPINTGTGNVYRREEDVQLGPWLNWVRYYNSAAPDDGNGPIGQHWSHSYQRAWRYQAAAGDKPPRVTWQREDGKVYAFEYRDGEWQSERDNADAVQWQTDADGQPVSWTLRRTDTNSIETYSAAGQLVRIVNVQGFSQQLDYENGQLTRISDAQGRPLVLARDAQGRIQDVALPDGRHYRYTYDAVGNLGSVSYPDNTQQSYLYDEAGHLNGAPAGHRLTGVIDPRGTRSDNYDYQSDGKAIATYTDGDINRHTVQYAADGSKATTTDPSGAVVTRNFSVLAGVPDITSLTGNRCQECGPYHGWDYDMSGHVHVATNHLGQKTTYTIDPATLLETVREEGARTTITRWDTALRLPVGRSHAYNDFYLAEQWQYNARGQVLAYCSATTPYNPAVYNCAAGNAVPEDGTVRRWSYAYCDSAGEGCPMPGLRLSATDPLGRITRYSYYPSTDLSGCNNGGTCHYTGDLYQITNPLGQVTTLLTYDISGRVTRWQDANGIISDLAYTPRGWLARQTVHAEHDATTELAYDAHGNLSQVTDPDGVVLHFAYDIAERLTDIADDSGNKIHYTLDNAGNRTAEQVGDANGLRERFTRSYSNLGRLSTLKDAQGQTLFTATSYDANGQLTASTDAYGVKRGLSYNLLGQLSELIEDQNGPDPGAANAKTSLSYNGYGQVTRATDPDNIATSYKIDGFGQATSIQSNDTGLTSHTYDAAGNLLTRTDARGIIATYNYDALNRITQIQYPDAAGNVTLAYDEPGSNTGCVSSYPVGRLTRRIESGVTTVYCYNAQGQVTQKQQITQGGTDTIAYSYSPAGRLESMRYPSGTEVTYVRDSEGRIAQVKLTPTNGAVQTLVSNVYYHPFGAIAAYTLGNGQTVTRSFDANDRITGISSPAFTVQYDRDAMGNIITTASNNTANGYLYDHLYRITQMQDGDGNPLEAYSYSKTGDRKSKAGNGFATGNYAYQNHWLTSTGNESRTYDAAGNTITHQSGGNQYSYIYDNANHLAQVQTNGVVTADYVYNLDNERIAKTINGLTERYTYNEASQLLSESGSSHRDYIWLDDMPVAVIDDGAALNYVITDALNTPRVITDPTGSVVWQWPVENNAFGEQQPTGNFAYNLRFPGQYYDEESGIFYNVHRYYDPATGRYVQSDPLGLLAGMNTYSYVGGNPLLYKDPTGQWAVVDDIVFIAGGAAVGALGQGVSDLLSGKLSGWEDYVGSAIGGAVGGETLLYTGPVLSGIASGATTSWAKQQLKKYSGKQCEFNWTSFAVDTSVGGFLGAIPGASYAGVTAGRGNWNAIFKQMTTKFRNGTISSVSWKTAFKMAGGRAVDTAVVPGAAAGALTGAYVAPYIPGYAEDCACSAN
jgi:RHS repeat-associated protein